MIPWARTGDPTLSNPILLYFCLMECFNQIKKYKQKEIYIYLPFIFFLLLLFLLFISLTAALFFDLNEYVFLVRNLYRQKNYFVKSFFSVFLIFYACFIACISQLKLKENQKLIV